jgi:Fe-S cluster biogenesis protein NfuA
MNSKSEELVQRVESAIDSIRPFLNADGGDIQLIDITDDFVAIVEMTGACRSCSMSNMTMKNGVEEAIRKAAPEITAVEAAQ